MSHPSPNSSRYLRILRASLAIGGIYDLVLAAALVLTPDLASRLLTLPRPSEDLYLWLLAVLLFMVAAVYLLAAYDPMAYAGNVLVAIGGRAITGAVLIGTAAGRSDLHGLYLPGVVDLLFATVHVACWRPLRRLRAQLL